ncbi:GNAT family N-acetyltransferase [Curvibacter gracilis]|uniref:GNAT family N-acetyltransferase n=1 Tax=Curvibacter gracilis TaxID=230310 RepID=UPI000488587D|nr:GNAT family N-acetyltransferase [Curvibacter gracilis]
MNTLVIAPLQPADLSDWLPLAQAYKAFYNTPTSEAEYQQAWALLLAGQGLHGLGARVQGQLVGITHYLFHGSTWAPRVCYLQDLYVSEAHRGKGTAAALIEAVAQAAREGGAQRLYWLSQTDNLRARRLYDRVAEYRGFIRYDHPMPG